MFSAPKAIGCAILAIRERNACGLLATGLKFFDFWFGYCSTQFHLRRNGLLISQRSVMGKSSFNLREDGCALNPDQNSSLRDIHYHRR